MLRVALAAYALLCLTSAAFAQEVEQFSTFGEMIGETQQAELPGPTPDETRLVYFWRPPNAPAGPLPVIYVADGLSGMDMIVAGIRRPILEGRMAPLLIVGVTPSAEHRTLEYALGRRRNPYWEHHYDWFVSTVMPWAEMHAGASTNAAERGVAGYSNGADWALATAERRPDLFSFVLAHSPVNEVRPSFEAGENSRWVLTAGRHEFDGDIASLSSRIRLAIGHHAVRQCIGPWDHDTRDWRVISPGSVAWLLGQADFQSVETRLEHDHCHIVG